MRHPGEQRATPVEGVEFIMGFFDCILAARVVFPIYLPLTSRVNRANFEFIAEKRHTDDAVPTYLI
ncbi:MAG: hypothetical protein CBC21_01745 [Proteobacteria bacterium TMED61]|nr:MAG: hypothetical protein CBC21_01745 [Proteobacteria bacterium TMED61]